MQRTGSVHAIRTHNRRIHSASLIVVVVVIAALQHHEIGLVANGTEHRRFVGAAVVVVSMMIQPFVLPLLKFRYPVLQVLPLALRQFPQFVRAPRLGEFHFPLHLFQQFQQLVFADVILGRLLLRMIRVMVVGVGGKRARCGVHRHAVVVVVGTRKTRRRNDRNGLLEEFLLDHFACCIGIIILLLLLLLSVVVWVAGGRWVPAAAASAPNDASSGNRRRRRARSRQARRRFSFQALPADVGVILRAAVEDDFL